MRVVQETNGRFPDKTSKYLENNSPPPQGQVVAIGERLILLAGMELSPKSQLQKQTMAELWFLHVKMLTKNELCL